MLRSYIFAEKFPLPMDDLIVQISSCEEKTIKHSVTREQAFKFISIKCPEWTLMPDSLAIAILQLNEQGVLIHEVIEVGYDVVVLEDGEDAYFVHDVSALLFGERIQLHLLPYHQRVVLWEARGDISLKQYSVQIVSDPDDRKHRLKSVYGHIFLLTEQTDKKNQT